ncbi:MAG: hypothetical protein J4F45_03060 [Pseudomonadales bacterium]|nr:hypothetical protein [Pseudomonadales bacterium]
MPRSAIRPQLTVAVLAATLGLGGCVFVVDSDSHYRHGKLRGSTSLDAIKPGTTSREWILEKLGQPHSSYVNEAGNEVLRYLSVYEHDTEVAFFLLFDIDVSKEEINTLHVELEEDLVRSFWID